MRSPPAAESPAVTAVVGELARLVSRPGVFSICYRYPASFVLDSSRWFTRLLALMCPGCAPASHSAVRLHDQPLRRSFRVLRLTAAFLIGAGSSSSGYRSVSLVSSPFWHATGTAYVLDRRLSWWSTSRLLCVTLCLACRFRVETQLLRCWSGNDNAPSNPSISSVI